MTKCSFCGKEEYAFKGIHLIKNDGSISYFCSSKCRVNALKLKRDKRKLKWTLAHTEERHKTIKKEAVRVAAEAAKTANSEKKELKLDSDKKDNKK